MKGQFLWRKGAYLGHAKTCPAVSVRQELTRGQHWYGADADWHVCVHIGASWQIRL